MSTDVTGPARGLDTIYSSRRAANFVDAAYAYWQAFLKGFRAHGLIHILALSVLVLGFVVSNITNVKTDTGTFLFFGRYLLAFFVTALALVVAIRLAQLAFIEKSKSPTGEILKATKNFIGNPETLARLAHVLIIITLFSSGFSTLKSSIAILQPFNFDVLFRDLDLILHFGYLPHEWIMPIVRIPAIVMTLNIAYNVWFVVLIAAVFGSAMIKNYEQERLQFLAAFILTWMIGGFFIATGFSSAGPVYFERLGLGTDYKNLMDALYAANEHYAIWALPTQEILWQGFVGEREGFAGISAFPSMHVALSVLIAIYANKVHRLLGVAAWSFAAVIMLGSVALGWHYAVDGYASFFIVLGLWWFAGILVARFCQVRDQKTAT